jgi:L-histidine N-alpha-methyltransferase
MLLGAMRRAGLLRRLTMFDINETFIRQAAARIRDWDSTVAVRGAVGDFVTDLEVLGPGGGRLALFFGGTIGNFHPDQVPAFLRRVAAQLRGATSDRRGSWKDRARLEAAYNDSAGVTAEFNRNLLRHVNRVLGGTFDPDAFAHVAFWDARHRWIEMRLRATRPVRAHVAAIGLDVQLHAGEEMRTEISCKYSRRSFGARVRGTGFTVDQWLTDSDDLFALALLRRTA